MRRLITRMLCMLAAFVALSAQAIAQDAGLDSAKTAALDAKLEEYFKAMERATVEEKIEECDFLVESCGDEATRQHVAVYIYTHYAQPTVMGEEAVAIHMVDKWFEDGTVKFPGEFDLLNARIFAQFNRNSLIGMKAPGLSLRGLEDEQVTIPEKGTPSVLFFYDTGCAKCKLQTILLRSMLPEVDFPLDFYAVYTGANRAEWDKYRDERWGIDTKGVRLHHLWDPEIDSNFQMEYGVLETPQMVLVDKDGTIIGRKLDVEALSQLLNAVKPYEYGNDESTSLFRLIFDGEEPDAAGLLKTAGYLKERSLSAKDSVLCKHLLGDFLYYLSDAQGEEYKLALLPFIRIYIDGDPGLWSDPEDLDAVIRPAQIEKDLLSRAPLGSRIAPLKVEGRMKTVKNAGASLEQIQVRKWRLRATKGSPTYLVFHTPGCSSCREVAEAAEGMLKENPKARFLFVEPDASMLDIFDLSVLPHIIELDKKGIITRKYLDLK